MIALAILLFLVLFLKVRSYKECMSGGGSSWNRDGYKYVTSLDEAYRSTHPGNRVKGLFMDCSPESHPYGCGSRASALNVMKRGRIQAIPHLPREPNFLF
jgi:hypothetical protein